MANKPIKMIPIDGEKFKHEIAYQYGSVRNFAKVKGYSARAIYYYIEKNTIPVTLLEDSNVKNVTDPKDYKKGYEDGYNAAMEEMKKFLSSMGA